MTPAPLRYGRSVFAAQVRFLACAAFVCSACARDVQPPGTPTIEFRTSADDANFGAVEVTGLGSSALDAVRGRTLADSEWHEVFAVRANDSGADPMFGTYTVESDRIRFAPRFPPVSGSTYLAEFNAVAFESVTGVRVNGNARGSWQIVAPEHAATTGIMAVYPTADSVPMNLLKLYVHFSAPMSVGQSMEHLRILDEDGREVEHAFLIPSGAEELWNPDKTRLTVLFDPGRIKRGLRPNEEEGLPLRAGRRYTIEIDSMWRDAAGAPLVKSWRRVLRVGEADRTAPDAGKWRVSSPAAGARGALVLDFPEPLDQALLMRLLSVHRNDGSQVPGDAAVSAEERRWEFTPSDAWAAGSYYVEVDTDLEDLAGNNLRKLFDVSPEDAGSTKTAKTVRVPFRVVRGG